MDEKYLDLDSVKISAGAPDLPELAAVAAVHVSAPPPALPQDAAHEEEAEGGRRAQVQCYIKISKSQRSPLLGPSPG